MDIKGDIIIREMEADDARRFQEKLREIGSTLPLYKSYLEETACGVCDYIAAYYEGEAAGFAKLDWQTDYEDYGEQQIPEIKELWVFENFRNKGVAHQMMSVLEEKAAKRSRYCAMGVGLSEEFEPAQRLLEALDYEPDGKGIYYMGEEVVQDDLEVDENQALMMIKTVEKR